MDRRKSIKSILLGSAAAGLVVQGCKTETEANAETSTARKGADNYFGRTPEEIEQIKKLNAERFFNDHEIETIGVIANLILPPKEPFGGPLDAKVPELIEFMAKDIPSMQTELRGGLMWLDHESNIQNGKEFKLADASEQKKILDTICYYDPEVPEAERPIEVRFFGLMRNLTLTGYYTSEMGIKDLGYKGNTPNVWDGVPEDVLAQHGVSYDPEWIAKCVDQSKRNDIAKWDEDMNLIT